MRCFSCLVILIFEVRAFPHLKSEMWGTHVRAALETVNWGLCAKKSGPPRRKGPAALLAERF